MPRERTLTECILTLSKPAMFLFSAKNSAGDSKAKTKQNKKTPIRKTSLRIREQHIKKLNESRLTYSASEHSLLPSW